jgi:3-methyladenine DNA glycosylase AlkD
MTKEEIIKHLEQIADPEKIEFKRKKYGIVAHNSLGVYQKDINALAKTIGKNEDLAIDLFKTNIYECRVLCSKVFPPGKLTKELMETWVSTFENWEICDSFSMILFARSELAVAKAMEWSTRTEEFEKRAAFAIMAGYCTADKKAENNVFEAFLVPIEKYSDDDRVYVKKAVSWALRNIGKRNPDLNKLTMKLAEKLKSSGDKAQQWVGRDAWNELSKPDVRMSNYPRSIYGS